MYLGHCESEARNRRAWKGVKHLDPPFGMVARRNMTRRDFPNFFQPSATASPRRSVLAVQATKNLNYGWEYAESSAFVGCPFGVWVIGD